ncbi:ran-binding protein 3-like isoform X2 [Homarus americanus]|uniref:ran-binding protein 3-like isoform X2 n=1 Tax=Homarus americanus TaxID=6706 RepID=UPI001C45830C|nr:ran-binding protein 3-like isoform X2 [Homarus americanus]
MGLKYPVMNSGGKGGMQPRYITLLHHICLTGQGRQHVSSSSLRTQLLARLLLAHHQRRRRRSPHSSTHPYQDNPARYHKHASVKRSSRRPTSRQRSRGSNLAPAATNSILPKPEVLGNSSTVTTTGLATSPVSTSPTRPAKSPRVGPVQYQTARGKTSARFRYWWVNQLTRIFLQEGASDDEHNNKEAEAATDGGAAASSTSGSSNSSSTSSSRNSFPLGDGISACSSSIDSCSSNNKVSSLSSPHSTSAVTTLASTGMGNPFARATPQATWGSESSDHRPILAPPRLSPHSDSGGPPVIRQSALGSSRVVSSMRSTSSLFTPPTVTVTGSSPPQSSKSEFKLKPSVLGSANPFSRTPDPGDKADSASGSDDGVPGTTAESSSFQASGQDVSSSTSTASSHTSRATSSGVKEDRRGAARPLPAELHTNNSEDSNASSNNTSSSNSRNLFLPLARNGDGKDGSGSPNVGSNNFIFGQNLQSKVAGAESSVTSSSDAARTTNGEKQTGNLFSEAASEISRPSEDSLWTSGQSLEESSRELTEKEKSQKRKFDHVEVITGEESESNVLQMNCKLYAWVSGSWQERGRGILRLNDWDAGHEIHSRLVIRTQGTLTVMLNTKVWAEMSIERASSKSVRFTALDADGQPKIFLAMGSPKDVDLLYNSLEWRVASSRSHTHDEGNTASAKKPKLDETGSAKVTS